MTEKDFYEWLKAQPYDDKIVSLKYKYSFEREWTYSNELLEVDPTADDPYIWETDWYEGQDEVEVLGCISISDVAVPTFIQADTPQTEERCEKCVHFMTNDMGEIWCIGKKTCEKFEPRSDTPQAEERPAGCSKDWSASCTSCERYFSCDYLSGRKTDCGRGE